MYARGGNETSSFRTDSSFEDCSSKSKSKIKSQKSSAILKKKKKIDILNHHNFEEADSLTDSDWSEEDEEQVNKYGLETKKALEKLEELNQKLMSGDPNSIVVPKHDPEQD